LKADSDNDGLLTSDDFYSVLVNMSTQYEWWWFMHVYFIDWLVKMIHGYFLDVMAEWIEKRKKVDSNY
jgi:hypothetical protein